MPKVIASGGASTSSSHLKYISQSKGEDERNTNEILFTKDHTSLTFTEGQNHLTQNKEEIENTKIVISFERENFDRLGKTEKERLANLEKIIGDGMENLFSQLGVKDVNWVGGIHLNTSHPHAHIVFNWNAKNIETNEETLIPKIPKSWFWREKEDNSVFAKFFEKSLANYALPTLPTELLTRRPKEEIFLPQREANNERINLTLESYSELNGISPHILEHLIKNQSLYLNRQGSLTFVRRDSQGNATGYVYGNGYNPDDKKGFFYVGNPNTAKHFVIAENPKEVLSTVELTKDRDLSEVCFVASDNKQTPEAFENFIRETSQAKSTRIIWAMGNNRDGIQAPGNWEDFKIFLLESRNDDAPNLELFEWKPRHGFGSNWSDQINSRNHNSHRQGIVKKVLSTREQLLEKPDLVDTENFYQRAKEIFTAVEIIRENDVISIYEKDGDKLGVLYGKLQENLDEKTGTSYKIIEIDNAQPNEELTITFTDELDGIAEIKRGYIQKIEAEFLVASQIGISQFDSEQTEKIDKYQWARFAGENEEGYEISTKGDKRFSSIIAKLADGRTIEEAYQLDVKGYRSHPEINQAIIDGKTFSQIYFDKDFRNIFKDNGAYLSLSENEGIEKELLKESYTQLWETWATENPNKMMDLAEKTFGKILTDRYAIEENNQARALAEILNNETFINEYLIDAAKDKEDLDSFDTKEPSSQIFKRKNNYALQNSQEITNQLKEIPLEDVMPSLGLSLTYDKERKEYVYRDNFKNHKIKVKGLLFSDRYQDKRGGKNALNLVMHVNGTSFSEARQFLMDTFGLNYIPQPSKEKSILKSVDEKPRVAFKMPEWSENKLPEVRDYLINQRALNPDLVDSFIERGDIFASNYGSANFVYRNEENQIKGVAWRATIGTKRGEIAGTDKSNSWFHFGDLNTAQKFIIVEAPIEVLSYIQCHPEIDYKNVAVISTGMASVPNKLINILEKNAGENSELTIAYNNDKAGQKGIEFLLEKTGRYVLLDHKEHHKNDVIEQIQFKGKITREIPTLDDWNEVVKATRETERYRNDAELVGEEIQSISRPVIIEEKQKLTLDYASVSFIEGQNIENDKSIGLLPKKFESINDLNIFLSSEKDLLVEQNQDTVLKTDIYLKFSDGSFINHTFGLSAETPSKIEDILQSKVEDFEFYNDKKDFSDKIDFFNEEISILIKNIEKIESVIAQEDLIFLKEENPEEYQSIIEDTSFLPDQIRSVKINVPSHLGHIGKAEILLAKENDNDNKFNIGFRVNLGDGYIFENLPTKDSKQYSQNREALSNAYDQLREYVANVWKEEGSPRFYEADTKNNAGVKEFTSIVLNKLEELSRDFGITDFEKSFSIKPIFNENDLATLRQWNLRTKDTDFQKIDTAFPKDWANARIFQNKMYEFVRKGLVTSKTENHVILVKGGDPLTEIAHDYLFNQNYRNELDNQRLQEMEKYREDIKHYEKLAETSPDYESKKFYQQQIQKAANILDNKNEQIEREKASFAELDNIYQINHSTDNEFDKIQSELNKNEASYLIDGNSATIPTYKINEEVTITPYLENIEEIQFGLNPRNDYELIKNNKLQGSYNFKTHALNVAFQDFYENIAEKIVGATYFHKKDSTISFGKIDETGLNIELKTSEQKTKIFSGYSFNRLVQENLISSDNFVKLVQTADLIGNLQKSLNDVVIPNQVSTTSKTIDEETYLSVNSEHSDGNYIIIKNFGDPNSKFELYKESGENSTREKYYAKDTFSINTFSKIDEVAQFIKSTELSLLKKNQSEILNQNNVVSEQAIENQIFKEETTIIKPIVKSTKGEIINEVDKTVTIDFNKASIKEVEDYLQNSFNKQFSDKGYDFSLSIRASVEERGAFDVFYDSKENNHSYPKYRIYKPTPDFEEWCFLKNNYAPPKNLLKSDFEITDKTFETHQKMNESLMQKLIKVENLKINIDKLTPTVLASTEQTGRIERRISKLLHSHNLAEEIASSKDFVVVLKNEPYQNLNISRGADGLIRLTHYYIQNGDWMHDGEMNFKLNRGILSLNQTAAALYGVPRYGYDRSFANMFSSNLFHQGFDKAQLIRFDEKLDEVSEEKIEANAEETFVNIDQTNKEPAGVKTGTLALAEEVKEKLDFNEEVGNNIAFNKMAERAFGGTRASGSFTSKDAYDALELGLNLHLIEKIKVINPFDSPKETLNDLRELIKKLPRQTDRTNEQILFQQFSTPPTESFVAAYAANLKPNDVVLEPSAGNGGLALWSKGLNIQTHVNEVSERRAGILKLLGFNEVNRKDAQFLNDTLDERIKPSVIIMNPPFSASGGRAGNDTKVGAEHLSDALTRLEKNGRIVCILGEGMSFENQKFNSYWKNIFDKYNVRANLGVPGEEYGKFGTTYGNQIIIIDKNGKTPGNNLSEQIENVVKGKCKNLEEVLEKVESIRNSRSVSNRTEISELVNDDNLPLQEQISKIYENARWDAIGAVTGAIVERLEQRGYRVIYGHVEPKSNLKYDIAGIVGPGTDRFIEKGLSIEKVKFSNIEFAEKVTRQNLKDNPHKVFIFGDNLQKLGFGGQAREMRGEQNAIGIPTKNAPSNENWAFFTDRNIDKNKEAIDKALAKLAKYSPETIIVFPSAGIGTGLADLENKAPETFEYLQKRLIEIGIQSTQVQSIVNDVSSKHNIDLPKIITQENVLQALEDIQESAKATVEENRLSEVLNPEDLADLENKIPTELIIEKNESESLIDRKVLANEKAAEIADISKMINSHFKDQNENAYLYAQDHFEDSEDGMKGWVNIVHDTGGIRPERHVFARIVELNGEYNCFIGNQKTDFNSLENLSTKLILAKESNQTLNLQNDLQNSFNRDDINLLKESEVKSSIEQSEPELNEIASSFPPIDLEAYWKTQANNPQYTDLDDNFSPEEVRNDYFNETFNLANSVLDLTEKTRHIPTTQKGKIEYKKDLETLDLQKGDLAFHTKQIGNFFGTESETFIRQKLEKNDIYINKDWEIKVYQLGAGSLGNGLTIWNRAENTNNDYKTIAHIGDSGKITIYEKSDLPEKVLEQIKSWRNTKTLSTNNSEVINTNEHSTRNSNSGVEIYPTNNTRTYGHQPGLYDGGDQQNESNTGNATVSSDIFSDEHRRGTSNENPPNGKARTTISPTNQSLFDEQSENGIRPSSQGDSLPTEQLEIGKSISEVMESGKNTEKRNSIKNLGVVEYKPAKLKGGVPHPGDIVESASMAAVEPPDITYTPDLDPKIIEEGKLSSLQLEAVCYAGMRHNTLLPNGLRAGFDIGDGTGLGKGREITGIALDNWNQGRKKILWLSINYDLVPSAERDLKDLGADIPIKSLDKMSVHDNIDDKFGDGILFSSYSTLTAKGKDGTTRFDQISKWLGDDALIFTDEGHLAKNGIGYDKNSTSQRGEAIIDLQVGDKTKPNWRFVYTSATGQTEPRNMGYKQRLGLWGEGTSFPGGFPEFLNAIENGGLGAMELVSRDTKAMGMYLARSISYRGVDYQTVEHSLTPEQKEIYNLSAQCWSESMRGFEEALRTTSAPGNAKRFAYAQLYASQQLFYRQLITALKVPSLISEIERIQKKGSIYTDPKTGEQITIPAQVIIGMIGTGEARTKEQMSKAKEFGLDLDSLDFSPKQILMNVVAKSFPTDRYATKKDPVSGNEVITVVTDDNGRILKSKEAERLRDELLTSLEEKLVLPDNPLDQIVQHFGENNVAEITGRDKRIIIDSDGRKQYVKRAREGVSMDKASQDEMDSFQAGRKKISVISQSASTGISLHSELKPLLNHYVESGKLTKIKSDEILEKWNKNKDALETRDLLEEEGLQVYRRVHLTLETGFSADTQMQTFGRSHRSNQLFPPEYVLLSIDLGGEKRFLSTIAKRLSSLGALTKGDREQAGGNLLSFDFENQYGLAAARSILNSLERNDLELISSLPNNPLTQNESDGMEILYRMGFAKEKNGGLYLPEDVLKNLEVTKFMNRLLILDVDTQNSVFENFVDRIGKIVEIDKENGAFDAGVTDLIGTNIRLAEEPQLVSTDKATGAKTYYSKVLTDIKTHPMSLEEIAQRNSVIRINGLEIPSKNTGTFYQQTNSKNIIYVEHKGERTDNESGALFKTYQFARPSGWGDHLLTSKELLDSYVPVRLDEVRDFGKDSEPMRISDWWTEQVSIAPKVKSIEHHLITGAVLPVFARLKSTNDKGDTLNLKTVRAETEDGERIIGINIPTRQISRVLRDLGIQESHQTPEQVYRALTDLKIDIELVGGINLKSTFFKQQPAIEVRNLSHFQKNEFQNFGVIKEIANYTDRYFVPTNKTKGTVVLNKILEKYPAVEAENVNEKPELQNKISDPRSLFYQRIDSLKELELKDFVEKISIETNEKGHIQLNEGSYEVISRAYQKAFDEDFPKFDGTFTEKSRTRLIKSSLNEISKENPETASKIESIRSAIETSEEIRGERGIIFLVDPEAAEHEEIHASSNLARFGESLKDGHSRFDELVNSESYQIAKPILSEKYKTNDDGLLVEETFAFAASGEGQEIGLTPEQSADFAELWFKSVLEKNPEKTDQILEHFEEINDESKQFRDNAYKQIREEYNRNSQSLGETRANSDSLQERQFETVDLEETNREGFNENEEFLIDDQELSDIYESFSIEHQHDETTNLNVLANYLNKYPSVSTELIDFAASRDFGVIKETTEYGKILDQKNETEQFDALNGITQKLARQVGEINNVDYESLYENQSDSDLVGTYYPLDEYGNTSNDFGDFEDYSISNSGTFYKRPTEINGEFSTALASEIVARSNVRDAEFEVKELLAKKNYRKYSPIDDEEAKPISLNSLDIEAKKFARTAVSEMWKNGAVVDRARLEKREAKEVSKALTEEAFKYKKELQKPERDSIEKAFSFELKSAMLKNDELTEIHQGKASALNKFKNKSEGEMPFPALNSKLIWQLQEKAIHRGDSEMFKELEEFNRALEIPRNDEAASKLYGLKELVQTKAKINSIGDVDDSKIKITISNKEGGLKVEEISLEETNDAISNQQEKIAKIKYPGLKEFAHPFTSQMNPLSTINGTFSWFTNPIQTIQNHMNPIQKIKNCPHAQIIRLLHKSVNAGIEHFDEKLKLQNLEKVKTKLEGIKQTKLTENLQPSLENYKLADAIDSSLKADAELRKVSNLEAPNKSSFLKSDLEEIRAKAEFNKDGELLQKYSKVAQQANIEHSIERTASRAVIADVELAKDSLKAFNNVTEIQEGVIEIELSVTEVANAFNTLEYADTANSLAQSFCPEDCNFRFTSEQFDSLTTSLGHIDGQTAVGLNEIVSPINETISQNLLIQNGQELDQFFTNNSFGVQTPIGTAGNQINENQIDQMVLDTFQSSAFDAMQSDPNIDFMKAQEFVIKPDENPKQNFTEENSLANLEAEREKSFQKMRDSLEEGLNKKSIKEYDEHLETELEATEELTEISETAGGAAELLELA